MPPSTTLPSREILTVVERNSETQRICAKSGNKKYNFSPLLFQMVKQKKLRTKSTTANKQSRRRDEPRIIEHHVSSTLIDRVKVATLCSENYMPSGEQYLAPKAISKAVKDPEALVKRYIAHKTMLVKMNSSSVRLKNRRQIEGTHKYGELLPVSSTILVAQELAKISKGATLKNTSTNKDGTPCS